METRCRWKTPFATEELAKQRLKEIKESEEKRDYEVRRVYQCVECGLWHLTHLTVQQYQENVKLEREKRIKKEASFWIENRGWKKDTKFEKFKKPMRIRF